MTVLYKNWKRKTKPMLEAVLLLGLCIGLARAVVTVLPSAQVIYNTTPMWIIQGTGFDMAAEEIQLSFAEPFQYLTRNTDYFLEKNDVNSLRLKLMAEKRWIDLSNRVVPATITLNEVTFTNDQSVNILMEPVIVGKMLNAPGLVESIQTVYQSSSKLEIKGKGLIGATNIGLYFDPPLYKEIAYVDVSKYPKEDDVITLQLRNGYKWQNEGGILKVIGIDTGGGPVKINNGAGVIVANVVSDDYIQDNNIQDGILIYTQAYNQRVYADTSDIVISGNGFDATNNEIIWRTDLQGNGINYIISSSSIVSLTLQLTSGSYWRSDFESLPASLTIQQVNSIPVGRISGGGADVAIVFERPVISSSSDNTKLFRTSSHDLVIHGTGFPLSSTGYRPELLFNTEIIAGIDYSISVLSRTEMLLTLNSGKAWCKLNKLGPLKIMKINTRNDINGWIETNGEQGITVAEVIEDVYNTSPTTVEVFPNSMKVYESILNQELRIYGNGFKDGMLLAFQDTALVANIDYTLDVVSSIQANLYLKKDKKWPVGDVILKSIQINGNDIPLGDNHNGVRIAIVLKNPVIFSSLDTMIHESQTKIVIIRGSGLGNSFDTKITIRPTSPLAYRIMSATDDEIRIQLISNQDLDWLPSFMTLNGADSDKKVQLQVASIATGAGEIILDDPVTVGMIIHDIEGLICDDSCEFAFDGVCDDSVRSHDDYYYSPKDENKDEYSVAACVLGTDCTDCGGVDAIALLLPPSPTPPSPPKDTIDNNDCSNTCMYPRDGVCDDPRGANYCALGTDCQDCGPVGADNFTRSHDDEGWWDDDDDYWTFNDADFKDQMCGLDGCGKDKKKMQPPPPPPPPPLPNFKDVEDTVLTVMSGRIYTIVAICLVIALLLYDSWDRRLRRLARNIT